jgi:hypothetical protein
MKALRPEEEWARQMMSRALAVDVVQHDDGSDHGMHDLDVLHEHGVAAVEVTAAADGESMALWRLMNDRDDRWLEPDLAGGWMVTLRPSARGKRVKAELPRLLGVLESAGVRELRFRRYPGRDSAEVAIARDLGVVHAHQSGTDFPGSIYVTLELPAERSGGFIPDHGNDLVAWVGEFLHDPVRRDVLEKLERSSSDERHAFVLLPGFTTAPFVVMNLLMTSDPALPEIDPELPEAVTDVWVASTWSSGSGLRWSPTSGWSTFEKFAA